MKKFQKIIAALTLTLFAAFPVRADDAVSDPLEPVNRVIFTFNEGVDVMLLEPVAKLYRFVLPDYALDRLQHAFVNIREPLTTANYVLQGNLSEAGDSTLRFLVNSTVGIAGLYDVMGDQSEDRLTGFGDTLAQWGVGPGPYLVLPIVGPSDFRSAVGAGVDSYTDPVRLALHADEFDVHNPDTAYTGLEIAQGIDARSRLIKQIDDMRKNSLDFYAALRSAYIQHRAAKVSGNSGAAPEIPDYN